MVAAGNESFYKLEGSTQKYYDIETKSYKTVPGTEEFIVLDNIRSTSVVWENSDSALHDIGDGVLCFEFRSKMNSLGEGVLRGLHYQKPPFEQTKLVRVIKGKVLDVAVDLRSNSDTYGKHESIILSEDNKVQFLIPKGFAHGFIVLSEEAIFSYKVDNIYAPNYDSGILFNSLNIDWKIPEKDIIVSEKDKRLNAF
jgi:dTDP-4-dehydrorhamnose 3,5-epimerase